MSLAYSTTSTLSNRHREAPRFPCSVRVWVHDAASGRWAHLETVDVSKGGCFVASKVLLAQETEVQLVVELSDSVSFPIIASVVRRGFSEGQGLQPGMGLRFLSADAAMVDKWLVAARCGRA
jgi:hypothetical protein